MAWNHEWANRNRTITASLTSIAAPSWTAAGAPEASDWASGSVGVAYRLSPQILLRAAFASTFVNPQVASYGGELGVNVAF
jgi:outer membrane lipase/esterase